MQAARNYRVWILFVAYGACFGIEILSITLQQCTMLIISKWI